MSSEENELKCEECEREFKSYAALATHFKRKHSVDVEPAEKVPYDREGIMKDAGQRSFRKTENRTGKVEELVLGQHIVPGNETIPPPAADQAELGHVYRGGTIYPAVRYPNGQVMRSRHPNGKGGWVHGEAADWQRNDA